MTYMIANLSKTFQQQVDQIDWEGEQEDTRYLTHSIHRYSGKFIPLIAKRAIELISSPQETILDPYMGSGTTILEANLANRNAIGYDINPLAVLISRAKVSLVSSEMLDELLEDMHSLCLQLNNPSSTHFLFPSRFDSLVANYHQDIRYKDEWYEKWFDAPVLRELIVFWNYITSINDIAVKTVSMVAFSEILRKCSNAHQGYPNVMFHRDHSARPLPSTLLHKKCKELVCSIKQLTLRLSGNSCTSVVAEGDATKLQLPECCIDGIVTHPPYIGSVPYAEYGQLSLTWLGHSFRELDLKLTGGRRQSSDVVERFQAGYLKMFKESFRVLKPGRLLFLMVGDPIVKGEKVDLRKMSIEFALESGFEIHAEAVRKGVNRRANKMGEEHLLFFLKPPL